jgi:hypothetical protein
MSSEVKIPTYHIKKNPLNVTSNLLCQVNIDTSKDELDGVWTTTPKSALLVDQPTAIQRGTRPEDEVQTHQNHPDMICLKN